MIQVQAVFKKTLKEFLRQRATLFWTIGWPIIWVVLGCFAFVSGIPEEALPQARGSVTIPMMVFALMIAGMANLPGSIGHDRERKLLLKLKSMPISPWKDILGRFLALSIFSFIAIAMVAIMGYVLGARIACSAENGLKAAGFLFVAVIASAGIGMLVGTFIKGVQGAIMTGVSFSVLSAAISGMMIPYRMLPNVLQAFSRIYPLSSANSSAIYLLIGEETAGYNPLNYGQVLATFLLSLLLFTAGLLAYTKICWNEE